MKEQIADNLERSQLYSWIRQGGDRAISYEILPDETTSAELISWRVYRKVELSWAVRIAARVDDNRSRMPVGATIVLPSELGIAAKIREINNQFAFPRSPGDIVANPLKVALNTQAVSIPVIPV